MINFVKIIYRWTTAFGIDLRSGLVGIWNFPSYLKNYFFFKNLAKGRTNPIKISLSYPCLHDTGQEGGCAKGHYFHQDLYVAQKVFLSNPRRHLDVGSRIDGLVAHIASYRQIEVMDIRPIGNQIPNIKFFQGDILKIPETLIGVYDSLSSLHVVEHIGLGRYGDQLDIDGHIKAIRNLSKILCVGGLFYLSVPFGPERIEYNAHRIFNISTILDLVTSEFNLINFSYVDDQGNFHPGIAFNEKMLANNLECQYGLGLFELKKK
jgi:hypothetical protein